MKNTQNAKLGNILVIGPDKPSSATQLVLDILKKEERKIVYTNFITPDESVKTDRKRPSVRLNQTTNVHDSIRRVNKRHP